MADMIESERTDFKKVESYYSRPDVQAAILEVAKDREIVSVFSDGRFGKRPDILQYGADIVQAVREGAVSFHASVERWQQPMKLDVGMTKQQFDALRTGWDVFIDVDVTDFEIAKATVKQIIAALKDHGVSSYSLKFTGGKSFHIGVPFESLPQKVDMKPTERMYPEALEKIIEYVKWYTTEPLRDALLAVATPAELAERVRKPLADIISNEGIEPFKIVSMDIFGSRHMFRLPYSVDYEEPICIEHEDNLEIIPIGRFVDKFFNEDDIVQTCDISNLNYRTVSLDLNGTLKSKFDTVKEVIRHRITEDLYEITLETGRKVKLTSGHSIYVLKNGKIDVLKGDKVKVGDYIIVPKRIPSLELFKDGTAIVVADELVSVLNDTEKRITFLCDFSASLFDKKIYNKKTKIVLGKRYKNVYNWKRYNIIPLDVYETLLKNGIIKSCDFWNAKIYACHHGGKTQAIPNKITIDKKLIRLLGYYTSEGSCELGKRHRISFSFGSHEKSLIEDCASILKSKFKLTVNSNIVNLHKTATQIVVGSVILSFLLTKWLKCGKTAQEKRVPSIVWIANNELKKEYLKGYLLGDGHEDIEWSKNSAATVSKSLYYDLVYLLSMLGLNYLLGEQTDSHNFTRNPIYYVKVSGKSDVGQLGFVSPVKREKYPVIHLLPIDELGLKEVILKSEWRNEYLKGNVIRRNKKFIINLLKNCRNNSFVASVISGDISFLKIKNIEKVKPSYKYAYDLSINPSENFVGGGCILLHNSMHEKSLLVSLPLKVEQIDKFQKEDATPEKVKVVEKFLLPEKKEKRIRDAEALVVEAFDWAARYMKEKPLALAAEKAKARPKIKIPETQFPPCVRAIYGGLADGRKRSVFILINFLRNMGWGAEEIEKRMAEWNEKNYPPLRSNYIRSQLRWHLQQDRELLPPNCDNENFYKSFGVCKPDSICMGGTQAITIKNPVNYAFRKMRQEGKRDGKFDKKRRTIRKVAERAEKFRKSFPSDKLKRLETQ